MTEIPMYSKTGKKLKKCCYIQPAIRESMKPDLQYSQPTTPFDDDTVHRLSYMPIDAKTAQECRLESMKLKANLDLNHDLKMDTNTIMNLSYQPNPVHPREVPRWAMKDQFVKPDTPMDLSTIYQNSYQLPGRFAECDEGAPDNVIVTYAENCEEIDGLIQYPGPHHGLDSP